MAYNEEEEVDGYQGEDQEEAFYDPGNLGSYNSIQLNEKNIEPDQGVSGVHASRNLQLGNVTEAQFKIFSMQINTAQKLINVPFDEGGWLLNTYGHEMFKELDLNIIMSNSQNGFLRRNNATQRIEQTQTILNKKRTRAQGVLAGFMPRT